MQLGYSIAETMRRTSLGRTKVYELLNSGELEHVKVGARTIVLAASIERLLTPERKVGQP